MLPNLGGQTGLNHAAELSKKGILKKYGVQIIGVQADAIERGEDSTLKKTMNKLEIPVLLSAPAYSADEALEVRNGLGYPVVVRPAYTLGGTGGGAAYKEEDAGSGEGDLQTLMRQIS